jgi:hypothetical protein
MGLTHLALLIQGPVSHLLDICDLTDQNEYQSFNSFVFVSYACGGVKAASENNDLGLIEHWLKNIRDVQRMHTDELSKITDPNLKHRRTVELNIQEQCFNLHGNSIVQQMQAKTGRPRIHGMVYDIADGKLHYLNINFKSQVKKYQSIYSVTDFHLSQPIDTRDPTREKKEMQSKINKVLFDTIDSDKDGVISQNELSVMLCQFIDDVDEKELKQSMAPMLTTTEIDYEKFNEIMETYGPCLALKNHRSA